MEEFNTRRGVGTWKGGGPESGCPNPEKVRAKKDGVQKCGAPKGGAPKSGGTERWEPKISRLFFLLPPKISLFVLSLGVFSRNFGGV